MRVCGVKDPELVAWSMRERAKQFPEKEVVVEVVYAPSEEQKKLYFNAGRWAAGATDWTARKAYEKVGKYENR